MKMRSSNLAVALSFAIKSQREAEAALGYTRDSALVAGWQDVFDALARHEKIEIVE